MPRNPTPKKPRPRSADIASPAATTERPEAPFRAIVELAPDALVVSDLAGYITLVNRQTEALFGYPREALLGQPVEILLPERFHAVHRQHRADYLAAPRTRPMGTRLRLWGRRSDGSEFPVSVSLSPLPAADTDGVYAVVSTIRDLSERQRLEAARETAEAAGQELRQLQAITDTALAHPQLDGLLNAVLERLQEVLEADNAAVLLLEEDGEHLVVRAARGPEAQAVGGLRIPVGEGFAGRIAATQAPLAVEDLSTYPVVNPVLHERLRSVVGVSLVIDGTLIGVLHIGSTSLRRFTEEEIHLLQLVGQRMALAIDHAQVNAREQQAHAEAAARAAELEATIEAMPEAVVLTDGDGRIVRVNAAYHALYATAARQGFLTLSPKERTRLLEVRDLACRPLAVKDYPLWRILRGDPIPVTDPVETRVRALDGRELVVSAAGAPLRDHNGRTTGAVVVTRDVTAQRLLEERLRFQASMLERTHDAIFAWELGGPIVYWNRGAELLYGYTAAEALGRGSHDLLRTVHPLPSAREFDALLLREGEWTGELTHTARDGRAVDVLSRHQMLREPDGRAYVLETGRDITERKRLERERMELLGLVAHDLSNPLAAIKSQVQLLQRRLAAQEALPAQSLDPVASAVRRMERLVAELRAMESLEAGQLTLVLKPSDLAQLCRDEAAAAHAGSGRDIALELPAVPVIVELDSDRIGQVLGNLLSNALKYSPAGRPVTLALTTEQIQGEQGDQPPGATGATAREGAGGHTFARVTVRDEGPGIPPVALSHLFERFYRVPGIEIQHGPGYSLGLGLYIARQLVERHSGQIGVETVVSRGSNFWFTLPLQADSGSSTSS